MWNLLQVHPPRVSSDIGAPRLPKNTENIYIRVQPHKRVARNSSVHRIGGSYHEVKQKFNVEQKKNG